MPRFRVFASALGGLSLLLFACGEVIEQEPTDDQDVRVGPEDEDDHPEHPDTDAPEDLGEFADQAIAAAADERGVAEDEVEILRSEEVEWPDGARGCPEEGEMYTQAIVSGYLVVLDAAGEEQSWHGGEDEAPFLCEDPQTDVVGDPDDGDDPADGTATNGS